jgi:hypothetical protein
MRQVMRGLGMAVLMIVGVDAHHSFPAFYFEDQTITIEGEVVEFDYRAPHAWLHIKVTGPQGASQTYGAEWSNPSRLTRDNIAADTLRPGDYVRVSGSPGRKREEYRLHLKAIERPSDGWRWGGAAR